MARSFFTNSTSAASFGTPPPQRAANANARGHRSASQLPGGSGTAGSPSSGTVSAFLFHLTIAITMVFVLHVEKPVLENIAGVESFAESFVVFKKIKKSPLT